MSRAERIYTDHDSVNMMDPWPFVRIPEGSADQDNNGNSKKIQI